jgi:hypothetical protein
MTKFKPFIAAVLTFLLVRLAVNNPDSVEKYYSAGFYPYYAKIVSSFSRLVPFSIWDMFWALIVFTLITRIFALIFNPFKLPKFLLKVAQTAAILYVLFYVSWGFNYFRPDLSERIGLTVTKTDEQQFRVALDTIIARVNRNHINIDISDYQTIDEEVEKSYAANTDNLNIEYPNGYRKPKTMIFSGVISKLGISGYFGPFFNEINLNGNILPMDYPFVLAHEKAHQFGIASEADANLAAFIVCSTSEHKQIRYSGYLTLVLYFLGDAKYLSDYKDYVEKIDQQVIDDIQFMQKYYSELRNEKMEKAHEVVYDAYLKKNSIESGIENYHQVVELAISLLQNISLTD